jgi:hypothetical protein
MQQKPTHNANRHCTKLQRNQTLCPNYPYVLIPKCIKCKKSYTSLSPFSFLLLCGFRLFLPRLPRNQTRKRHRSDNSNNAGARDRSRSARFGATARAVVGDVVPLGGDFEDGAGGRVAAVVVVDEEEVGRGAVVA